MKKATQSKTIRIGAFYVGVGVLLGALQIFDQLEMIISPMISADSAVGWGSVALAIVGGAQIWLRLITSQPIDKG
jgi:L-asparagine transporter-like permease